MTGIPLFSASPSAPCQYWHSTLGLPIASRAVFFRASSIRGLGSDGMNVHGVGDVALLFELGVKRWETFEILVQDLHQADPTAVGHVVNVVFLLLRLIPVQLFIAVRPPWISLGLLYPW